MFLKLLFAMCVTIDKSRALAYLQHLQHSQHPKKYKKKILENKMEGDREDSIVQGTKDRVI